MFHIRTLIAAIVVSAVLPGAIYAGTTQLTENGDGTATLSSSYATFNWIAVCRHFDPHLRECGDRLDWNTDGVDEQWAVDGGHCTQEEADGGVLIKDATAYGTPTCDAANLANNRCRGPEDPGKDQTGYDVMNPAMCRNFIRAITGHNIRQWRDSGYVKMEKDNVVIDTISGPVED